MNPFKFLLFLVFLSTMACQPSSNKPVAETAAADQNSWKTKFDESLPILGHRNWIIVADKAFPQQTAAGIEYIDTHEKLIPVLQYVLEELKKAGHVEPAIYQDKELQYISEDQSKGIDQFKTEMNKVITGQQVQTILHDSVFTKLDQSSKLFKVLVLKTDELLPYTSVFMQLNCAYWNGENEQKLRQKMAVKP